MLHNNDYLLLSTKQLINILDNDDFQWVWAVFSAIPSKYQKEEILRFELPHLEESDEGVNNTFKVQHPYAEFELNAVDSTYIFLVSDNDDLISKFKKSYPLYMEK